ncbi:hypothetical protein ACFYXM_02525 [Streptomyces sp. NPDC002476]|uniref:hypothetical protein n=1 Tax=Streptomyces sp. NPDC002476 TaxID=3364648 RepID=UPI00367CC6B4
MCKGEPIEYLRDEAMVVIPPGDPEVSTAFAVFDESVEALRTFVLGRLERRGSMVPAPAGVKCDVVVPVVVSLVPRPDNSYDERAVSVAAPRRPGRAVRCWTVTWATCTTVSSTTRGRTSTASPRPPMSPWAATAGSS